MGRSERWVDGERESRSEALVDFTWGRLRVEVLLGGEGRENKPRARETSRRLSQF